MLFGCLGATFSLLLNGWGRMMSCEQLNYFISHFVSSEENMA